MSSTIPAWEADPVSTDPPAVSRRGCTSVVVPNGARVAGAVGDAIIDVDVDEHTRRTASALAGVSDLGLLDALLCLPFGVAVQSSDLSPRRHQTLMSAPVGCVQWSPDIGRIRRLLTPVVEVTHVVVRETQWRRGLRRACAFEPFSRRVVLFEDLPGQWERMAWEADVLGVGVWVGDDVETATEVIPPSPWMQRYVKPAGWRFRERAYSAWISATLP